jgi:hypothetical protein
MDPISNLPLRMRRSLRVGALRMPELAQEIDALHHEAAWCQTGCCAKTLAIRPDVSTMLFALKHGCRIRVDPASGGVLLRVVAGHVELHVGDVWDELPYLIRHTEGACSFFSLYDHNIDLPAGSMVVVEPALPHDIEALDDSAFLLDT